MPDAYKGFRRDVRTDRLGPFAVGDPLYNHNRKFNEETRPNLVFSIFYQPQTQEISTGAIGERPPGGRAAAPCKWGRRAQITMPGGGPGRRLRTSHII